MVLISMAMQSILFTACLLIICLSVDSKGNLQPDKRSSSSFESTPAKNCTTPTPPMADAMLKWRAGRDNNVFQPGEKAEFVCKEGFRQIGWLETLTCQNDGNWSSNSYVEDDFKSSESASGFCVTNHCNGTGTFNCTTNKSVDICRRCDCVPDCRDGSDEKDCGPILINVTERATGEMKYPENTNTGYTGPVRCSRTLWTDDPGFYIKLLFTNFSFPGDCDDNYLFLNNATFSGDETSPDCCKKCEKVACGFGAKSGAPPLSHTAKNFMIITVVSKESNSSQFTAEWFNVNGLFPYGVVPKDDAPYPENIKIDKKTSKKTDNAATDSTYVAAVVILSIFAFILLAILACKLGQHLIGPQCSVGYCCAWIAAKRRQRSIPRAPSPETTPIRRDINDEDAQGRSQRTVLTNDGRTTLRTRYGSAEEIS